MQLFLVCQILHLPPAGCNVVAGTLECNQVPYHFTGCQESILLEMAKTLCSGTPCSVEIDFLVVLGLSEEHGICELSYHLYKKRKENP